MVILMILYIIFCFIISYLYYEAFILYGFGKTLSRLFAMIGAFCLGLALGLF